MHRYNLGYFQSSDIAQCFVFSSISTNWDLMQEIQKIQRKALLKTQFWEDSYRTNEFYCAQEIIDDIPSNLAVYTETKKQLFFQNIMLWIYIAVPLAGIIAGFAAGGSPSPTGGTITSTVGAFLVGGLAGLSTKDGLTDEALNKIGLLATIFLLSLLISYIVSNILRKKGALEWMGLSRPPR